METDRNRPGWDLLNPTAPLPKVVLLLFVATLCYLAARLGGVLIITVPQTLWPLWPGCAVLVGFLLLCPRRIWPILLPAGLLGFIVYDLQAGLPIRSIAWLILSDTLEIIVAAWGVSYFLNGLSRIDTLNALLKYIFFTVILASLLAATIGSYGMHGDRWISWRTGLLSEGLAFLTVTPAILGCFGQSRMRERTPPGYYLEAAVLVAALISLCYLMFVAREASAPPALLYSLVPFLLWSALRFGLTGASTSAGIVALLSIWGTVHGRGPFTESDPLNRTFFMQLFLLSAAVPFMVLAVLVEERKSAEEAMRKGGERFRLAAQAGKMFAYEWDASTDVMVRSPESLPFLQKNESTHTSGRQISANCHPEDRGKLADASAKLTPENPRLEVSYRTIRPDGSIIWVEGYGRAHFDERGQLSRIIGMVVDVTEKKKTEETLHQREKELLEAQRVSQIGSWQWNPQTDEVAWSKELYRIAGRDDNLPPPGFREQTQLYTPESWARLKRAVAEALQFGSSYTLDLEVVRPDGSTRWVTARGEAMGDGAGGITGLRGTAQDITARKHAEDELRASEEKFRSVFREAGVGMVIVSPDGRFLATNEALCECLGYTEEELLQKTIQSVTLPEDWPPFSDRLSEVLEQGTSFQRVEVRWLQKSGRIVATENSASLIRGPSGEPRYFVGEVLDVTQRRLAEETLSGVSGRLIEAHEEERTWIARELHDDFNQRVALLANLLEGVKQDLPTAPDATRRRIEEACQCVGELGSDIQALSHRLHSSKLEYLGLASAVAGFCKELSARQHVKIDFHSENIPSVLPKEISLCLFRVLQEALQNSLKHSGEKDFAVALKCTRSEIELTVHDSGVGFDPEKVISGHGLGLTSMKERLKLVGGQLSIGSKPQEGTTIHARVPLRAKGKSAGAVK